MIFIKLVKPQARTRDRSVSSVEESQFDIPMTKKCDEHSKKRVHGHEKHSITNSAFAAFLVQVFQVTGVRVARTADSLPFR